MFALFKIKFLVWTLGFGKDYSGNWNLISAPPNSYKTKSTAFQFFYIYLKFSVTKLLITLFKSASKF